MIKIPLIVEINSSYIGGAPYLQNPNAFNFFKGKLYFIFAKFILTFCDGIRVLTPFQKKMMNTHSLKTKKLFCFNEFVPTHLFPAKELSAISNIVLFIGYPYFLKGVDILIKAFNQISPKYPNIVLKIVGFKMRESAERDFRSIDKRITFITSLDYPEIIRENTQSICLVLPSRTEGMGRVLIEAMASGRPVIGSNVGGIPEVIEDGRNGFLFESENVNDLADKLEKLLSKPELAKRMGEEGRKIVQEKFSSEKYCEHFTQMVHEVLKDKA
jgi:glycosyltransferase involved in cell wall biosynthesis